MRRGLLLRDLVLCQHLAGPLDYLVRQTCQLGDLDSVTAIGGTRLHFAKEYDAPARLFYRNVIVLHSGKLVGEFGEFKIMRREQRLRADPGMQILDSRPGNGEAVVGCGATPDLVQQN